MPSKPEEEEEEEEEEDAQKTALPPSQEAPTKDI
ncbi:mRNA 3'-end-processing protein [Venturia inaequalis]|nr:mRNA 3'-end-processing protein [Venturia inaequalis]